MTDGAARRGDWKAIALLLSTIVLLFADVLFLGARFFIRDLTRYYYPTKRIVREVILSGEMPYWNRYYSAGQPMAANPEYEVFYPPQWLVLLPDYDLGYRLHILVHLALAAAGMYAFLRSLALRRESSIFGALVFGTGGLVVSLVNLLPILFVIAWCPLIFLFARRAILWPNVRDGAIAALLLGVQALAGEPTSLLQTWFLIGCYAFYRGWESRRGGARAFLAPVAIALAMGIAGGLAGAAQLLPAAEHAGESARARPFDYSLVTAWSMPWARPLELVVPHLFGHIGREGTWYWGSGMYPGTGSPFFFSIYGGILMAALLAGSLAVRPRAGKWVLALCGMSALLALGGHTPLFRFLYDQGIATSIRYPEKWSFFGLFALIVFAAAMFDRILDGDRKLIDAAIGFTGAVTLLGLGAALFSLTEVYAEWFPRIWKMHHPPTAEWMTELSRRDWWMFAARGAIALVLLWGARVASGRTSRLWFGAVVLFVIADLAPVGLDALPRVDKSFYTPPPLAAELDARKKSYRIFHEADWYGSSDIAKKYFGTGDAVYWIVRNGIYPQTPATWGFSIVLDRDYDKTALLPTIDLVESMWKVRDSGAPWWRETFMGMSNAWYRSEYRPFADEKERVGSETKTMQPVDLRSERRASRYYFADSIEKVSGKEELVNWIVASKPSPRAAFVGFEPFEPASGQVLRAAETANSATLDVEAEGTALLVMSVTPHKYWSATLDGAPVELRIVNLGFQGVVVPAGRHRVVMRYENGLVKGGLVLSLVLFVLLGTTAVLGSGSGVRAGSG